MKLDLPRGWRHEIRKANSSDEAGAAYILRLWFEPSAWDRVVLFMHRLRGRSGRIARP